MKIKKIVIFLLIMILGIKSVNAKEVDAKYQYLPDDSIYSKKMEGKETSIELDSFNILINDSKGNNNNVKIISITDDTQLKWISENTKNNNIIKAYYFIFEDENSNQTNADNLNIKLKDNKNKYTIYTISSDGKLIDISSQSDQEIKLSNNNYFVIAESSDIKKIKYQANNGGILVLDGEIISESGEYTFKSNKIIIRIDSGYELKSATLNDKNILDSIVDGFLDVSKLNSLNLNLEFIKVVEEISSNSYDFSGQVIYNGQPLANANVELHSTTLKTTTDKFGNFYFENISIGKHSITISHNDKVIGYSEFFIKEKDDSSLELVYKNNEKIITNQDGIDLILYINDNYDVTIKDKEETNDIANGQTTNKHNYIITIDFFNKV